MWRNNRRNDDGDDGPAQSMPRQIAQDLFGEWTCENIVEGGEPCGDINHCTRSKCGGCKGLRSTEEMWAQPPRQAPVQGNYTGGGNAQMGGGNAQMAQMGYAVPQAGMHAAAGQYPAQAVAGDMYVARGQPIYPVGPVQQGMQPIMMQQPMMMQQPQHIASMQMQQPQHMASMQMQQPQHMASMQMMQPQKMASLQSQGGPVHYGVPRGSSDTISSASGGWNSGRSESRETRVSGMYQFPSEDGRGQWQDGSYVGQDR